MGAQPMVMQNPVRAGVEFDQSHPRNKFAVQPRVATSNAVVSAPQSVDWSGGGMPVQVQRTIIQGGGGAAHVSPFQEVKPASQIPLSVLRSQGPQQYAPRQIRQNVAPRQPI